MSLLNAWKTFDHYAYGAVAVLGTAAAIAGLAWAMTTPAWHALAPAMQGVSGPFVNVLGVLFGLTLAFLANDTWTAHAQARNAVLQEADAIRGLDVLLATVGDGGANLRAAVRDYMLAATDEWRALARCTTSADANHAADDLLRSFAGFEASQTTGAGTNEAIIGYISEIRSSRDTRAGLSRTHVNPLKWLSMAFLGFLTLVTIAVIHAEDPLPALIAMSLFGLAAAPTAAIVLIHGNPFQPPYSVSPAALREALDRTA